MKKTPATDRPVIRVGPVPFDLDALAERVRGHVGIDTLTLYRIPASSVSYHPRLADARVWFTGKIRQHVHAGWMAEFRFADLPPRTQHDGVAQAVDRRQGE